MGGHGASSSFGDQGGVPLEPRDADREDRRGSKREGGDGMRVQSWEEVGLDQRRAICFAMGVAASFFVVVVVVGGLLRIGSVSFVLGAMAAAGAGYLVSTAPRRIVRMAAFQQTLEAPSFAASSNIYLKATSSRSKTFLALRAEEPRLRSFLAEVRRRVLLGYDASSATGRRPAREPRLLRVRQDGHRLGGGGGQGQDRGGQRRAGRDARTRPGSTRRRRCRSSSPSRSSSRS